MISNNLFKGILALLLISMVQSENNCPKYMGMLHRDIGEFYKNATLFSVESDEFYLCRNVSVLYQNITQLYKKMEVYMDPTTNKSCLDKYIHNDPLDVFYNIYKNIPKLWDDAKCFNCYESWDDEHKVNLSESTVNFFNLSSDLKSCIKEGKKHQNDNKTICNKCESNYTALNALYESIRKENGKLNICFDIENTMNKTRRHWSADLGCCRDQNSPILNFILSASMIGCLPIVFYILAFTYTKRSEMMDTFPVNNEESGQVQGHSVNTAEPGPSQPTQRTITNIYNLTKLPDKNNSKKMVLDKKVVDKKVADKKILEKQSNVSLAAERAAGTSTNLINLSESPTATVPVPDDVPPLNLL